MQRVLIGQTEAEGPCETGTVRTKLLAKAGPSDLGLSSVQAREPGTCKSGLQLSNGRPSCSPATSVPSVQARGTWTCKSSLSFRCGRPGRSPATSVLLKRTLNPTHSRGSKSTWASRGAEGPCETRTGMTKLLAKAGPCKQ